MNFLQLCYFHKGWDTKVKSEEKQCESIKKAGSRALMKSAEENNDSPGLGMYSIRSDMKVLKLKNNVKN